MKKIKILGGGISGLSAAINVAKAGYGVEVYERGKDCGTRFKGDLQGLENWSEEGNILEKLKSMNIKINFDCDPVDHMKTTNGKKTWNFKFSRPAFYLVKRGNVKGSLEQGLKKQAIKLGVKIYFNTSFPENQADIVATGPNIKKIFAIDKGFIFKTKHKDLAVGLVDDEDAYQGYSYLLITKGYGCIATCIGSNFENVNDYLEKTEDIFEKIAHLKIKRLKIVGGIGSFSLKNKFTKGKRLYVGEAAGLQDLMWGFGMRAAIVSGYLAAKSIIERGDYEKTARAYFEKKLKASVVNRYIWDKFSNGDYLFIINRLYKAKDTLNFLRSYYNFNLIQKILFPLALKYCRKKYRSLKL